MNRNCEEAQASRQPRDMDPARAMHPRMNTCRTVIRIALALCAANATAAVVTVGPHGSFATIQAGIAASAGSNDVVRIETGHYEENIILNLNDRSLELSGGWNSTFSVRDPLAATTLDGGGHDSVMAANASGSAHLTLDGLTLTGGTSSEGGGLNLGVGDSANVRIVSTTFRDNLATASASNANGGGMRAAVFSDGALIVERSAFLANTAMATGNGTARGGGMSITSGGFGNVSITNSVFIANRTYSAVYAAGAGIDAGLAGAGRLSFVGNVVASNGDADSVFSGLFASGNCAMDCSISVVRSRFSGNLGYPQVSMGLGGADTVSVLLSNLLIDDGDGGVFVQMDAGAAHLVNLTVANNQDRGISLVNNDRVSLYNTIAHGNGVDLANNGGAIGQGNLIGQDPGFVDSGHRNYRLRSGAPAIDIGTPSPPGGLGLFDLPGQPRNVGAAPDAGAYEFGDRVFRDGLEIVP